MNFSEVLIIDDEKQILSSLKRTFKDVYLIHAVDSIEASLDVLKSRRVDAILCDHNLNAEITGVELLSKIDKDFPYISKMMFTGYKDGHLAEVALLEGKIFRFITKPWDEEFLKTSFELAVKRTKIARKNYELIRHIEEQNKKIETANNIMQRELKLNEKKVQESEKKISSLEHQVESINRLMAKISRAYNFEAMIESLLHSIKGVVDCDHSSVLNIKDAGKTVDIYSVCGHKHFVIDELPGLNFLVKNMEQTSYGPIFLDQGYRGINSKILNLGLDVNVGSMLLYPFKELGDDNTDVFVIVLARDTKNPFSKSDVYRLKDLSICISSSLAWINTATQLRDSLKKWQEVFNAVLDPLFIITRDHEISIYNSAFEKLLPEGVNLVSSQKCYKVIKGLDHVCLGCKAQEVFKNPITLKLDRASCFNDTSIVSTLYPLSKHGEVLSVVIYNNDRRAEFKLYKQLLQSSKLAAIGHLASDIAHEFNNPLGGILAYAQLLRNEGARYDSDLVEIEKACKRANSVISNLMQFSRDTSQDIDTVFSVKKAIDDTLPLLKACIKQHELKMSIDNDTDEYLVLGNPGKIQQVVFNLITNAAYASSGVEGKIEINLSKDDRSNVRMEFRDSGCGIAQEHLERVFEPFFTTKPKGQGTGLGLYVCHGIIKDHGGTISIDSEQGRGTTFTIEIPSWSQKDDLITC